MRWCKPLALVALILLAGAARPAWGQGCASGACGWSVAPGFTFPGAVVCPASRPSPDEMEAARTRVLARREAKARAAAAKARRAGCVDQCGCPKCGNVCPCRDGTGRCGDGCSCVVPRPRVEASEFAKEGIYFGRVDPPAASGDPPYTLNGKPVSRTEAMAAVGADPRIPDDAKLPRLTLIGSETDCKRVADDLATAPELAPFKGRLVVQSYRPDHPLIARYGFDTKGSPTIYAQSWDASKQFHNKDGKYAGAMALATALRKVDPAYDPKKDGDLWGTGGLDLKALSDLAGKVPAPVWAAGLLGGILLIPGSKKKGGQ